MIFHKKDTEVGVIILQVKDLISSSVLKILCVHFYHAPYILLWDTKYRARKQFCRNYKKKLIESLYFPDGK